MNKVLNDWVNEISELTCPDRVVWCDGSQQEYQGLIDELVASGDFTVLNEETYPGCYLYRSDPQDVARVEHLAPRLVGL